MIWLLLLVIISTNNFASIYACSISFDNPCTRFKIILKEPSFLPLSSRSIAPAASSERIALGSFKGLSLINFSRRSWNKLTGNSQNQKWTNTIPTWKGLPPRMKSTCTLLGPVRGVDGRFPGAVVFSFKRCKGKVIFKLIFLSQSCLVKMYFIVLLVLMSTRMF